MPHLRQHHERKEKEADAATPPPKGCMAVRVGQEGEEQRRFVVPVAYLSHPLFAELLEEAAEEYGFSQRGAIAIPCGVQHFRHVQDVIDRERGSGAVGGLLHHRNHHHQHGQQSHHHFPHLAGCFGA
ncbi:auxin-responsive protein SAUR32-like [Canna indica]|uniref:Auxin-responsive protein SAUR32-like n=1 Tax=Canna indica TaxID=4628 RepID=A0AAQ3K0S4_9LILI|nr:auxin-responsive protein SAUR32-like [Canna indica]